MGYLQALQLMVRAYKAAKGVMPKGLDLLKLKMRARKKAIDAKKVIEFPKDKITPFYTPRPEGIQNLIKRGDVKIGQAPKTTKVKEPVDPKLIMQESEKEMAKRMMRENKEAIKRFKEKMKKPRDDKATGGLANISQTYHNNPTLQSQYPNKQDYLDLFSSTTTTTPQTQTYTQMTQQSPAGITAVKPIVPIIQPLEGEGGGGTGPKGFDKGYSSANFGLGPNKDVVDYEAEAYKVGRTPLGTASQIITGIPSLTKLGFQFAKSAKQKAKDALEDFFTARAEAKAKEVARIARQNLAASMGSDAGPGEGAGTFGASVNEATGARGSGTGFSDYS